MAIGKQVPDKTLLKSVNQKILQRSAGGGAKVTASVASGTASKESAKCPKQRFNEQQLDAKSRSSSSRGSTECSEELLAIAMATEEHSLKHSLKHSHVTTPCPTR